MPDPSPAPAPRSKYDLLIEAAQAIPSARMIVAHPCDGSALRGAVEAAALNLVVPTLVGPEARIRAVAAEHGIDIGPFKIVDVPHSHAAAEMSVALIREGLGDMLMKGSLHTDELMQAVTASATGLRTERRISHVFVMDVPGHADTLFITDAAVNIFPRPRRQARHRPERHRPLARHRTGRAARRDPVGRRDGDDQDPLHHRRRRAVQDGRARADHRRAFSTARLAFDNAIDPGAARIKGLTSPVAGRGQILVVPDLEAGKHAGQEPHLPHPCRCGGCGDGRAGADRADLARRSGARAAGLLRGRRALRGRAAGRADAACRLSGLRAG
jgi:phosphate acetyltransferase